MFRFLCFTLVLCLNFSLSYGQKRSEKKGIAYGHLSEADISVISPGLSWWYNWSVSPESGVSDVFSKYGMDFVPMAWGSGFNEVALRNFYSTHSNAKYLLAFNEPNFTTQSNLTPAQVAALWPKLESIAHDYNLKIVGPAVNYCDKCISVNGVTISDPVQYLDSFFAACPSCQVDYIAVHNYMCYSTALSDYLNRFKKYKKPIWLTEFACWDQSTITLDMQKSLVIGALDLLENDTSIYRYAWFTGDRSGNWPYLDIFQPQSGKLSELGSLYVNFEPVHDTSFYAAIPARIEAENYSTMSGVALEATKDYDGVANVGWIDANDWLEYNIEVPASGTYYLYLRIASNSQSTININEGQQTLNTLNIASTGGWQNWKNQEVQVSLTKGKHKITLATPTGGFNINWLAFRTKENLPPVVHAGDNQVVPSYSGSTILKGYATDADSDNLSFMWTKVSGPSTGTIQNSTNDTTSVTQLSMGDYLFRLTASDGIETSYSEISVKVSDTTPVLTIEQQNTTGIYPNPVTDKLFIDREKSSSDILRVYIINMNGIVMLSKVITPSANNPEIDVSSLKKGQYIIKLESNKTTKSYSFIKQ